MLHDRIAPAGYNPAPTSHPPRRPPPPGRHPDDDRVYRRPHGWLNAKRAFGVRPGDPESGGEAGRALVLLETYGPGCPRFLLAVAVHLFLSVSREAQAAAVRAYDAKTTDERRAWLGTFLAGDGAARGAAPEASGPDAEPGPTATLWVRADVADRLRSEAAARGLSVSTLLRQALAARRAASRPWLRPGWRTEVLHNCEYDDRTIGFTIGLKEAGDAEHDASDTLALIFARPYRTAAEARELAHAIATDPDGLDCLAGQPGVIDRRAVVAAKFAGGRGAQ